jgi:hypothetical protein
VCLRSFHLLSIVLAERKILPTIGLRSQWFFFWLIAFCKPKKPTDLAIALQDILQVTSRQLDEVFASVALAKEKENIGVIGRFFQDAATAILGNAIMVEDEKGSNAAVPYLEREANSEFILRVFRGEKIPAYAILYHTWSEEDQEVTFQDVEAGTSQSKAAYRKLQLIKEKAAAHGLEYFWIDTCCIDKQNSTEVSEAIVSMFSCRMSLY